MPQLKLNFHFTDHSSLNNNIQTSMSNNVFYCHHHLFIYKSSSGWLRCLSIVLSFLLIKFAFVKFGCHSRIPIQLMGTRHSGNGAGKSGSTSKELETQWRSFRHHKVFLQWKCSVLIKCLKNQSTLYFNDTRSVCVLPIVDHLTIKVKTPSNRGAIHIQWHWHWHWQAGEDIGKLSWKCLYESPQWLSSTSKSLTRRNKTS